MGELDVRREWRDAMMRAFDRCRDAAKASRMKAGIHGPSDEGNRSIGAGMAYLDAAEWILKEVDRLTPA